MSFHLNWIENSVLTTAPINASATGADSATFKITDARLYVPVVTLSIEDNTKLSKLLNEGFRRPVYWNEYKRIDNKVVKIAVANREKLIRELLDSSYQGVKRLLVLAYDNTDGNNKSFYWFFQKIFSNKSKNWKL